MKCCKNRKGKVYRPSCERRWAALATMRVTSWISPWNECHARITFLRNSLLVALPLIHPVKAKTCSTSMEPCRHVNQQKTCLSFGAHLIFPPPHTHPLSSLNHTNPARYFSCSERYKKTTGNSHLSPLYALISLF